MKLSEKQKAFRDFFFDLMDEFEIDSPAQLDDSKKIEFFNQVKKGWKAHKKEHFNESKLVEMKGLILEYQKIKAVIQKLY